MFDSLDISGSGMYVHQNWMDAVSDNIANVNTVRPSNEDAFQARYVIAQAVENGSTGAGVRVAGVELGDAQGRLVYDPEHPYADAQGYVRQPDIDMGDQMTQMVMAQRGYQANTANLDRVRAAYQAAIQMGRS
ncbi:flagellar basal body rod protein FlgC [Kineosporia succinea]|uniref:Flagellar basal-body rod protein FlgC n=1 Tax=Kineosporia succinea TaxID=84632 RepID=A0ABT9P1E9_9ACTN|nr:flagellar basal body rod protein FlgC [Kineosporia succinea]MDP9826509.1 flagellar basal-body rod protein FlgC [Kineosporia succinea]